MSKKNLIDELSKGNFFYFKNTITYPLKSLKITNIQHSKNVVSFECSCIEIYKSYTQEYTGTVFFDKLNKKFKYEHSNKPFDFWNEILSEYFYV